MKLENLAICILSHERHEKIKKTLDSYKESSFLDLVDESFIYFNQMSKDDISLAEDYEMVYCGCEYNLGIGWGMTSAINVVESDYVLFLENDFILPTSKEETYRQLSMGLELVKKNELDLVKYRSLKDHFTTCNETKNWFDQGGRHGFEPEVWHLGFTADDEYGHNNLDICELIAKDDDIEMWRMSSQYAHWSNNHFLCRRDWFLEYASQIGFDLRHRVLKNHTRHPDFEGQIGDSWVKKKCNVGIIKPALFEHQY